MKKFFLFLFSLLCLVQIVWACPPSKEVEKGLKHLFPRAKNLHVEKVRPSPVPGFCEAILVFHSGNKNIIYLDEKGRFAFLGRLYDLKTSLNLTELSLAEIQRLSPQDLQKLDQLVAFEVGRGPKLLYLITDPQCPFCRRLEATLDGFLKEDLIRVKVILYPLVALHPASQKECVSLICDHQGWKALLSGYSSENQCPEGKKKVEEARKLLPKLGVRGTPAIILPDGRLFPGAKSREQLIELLGIQK